MNALFWGVAAGIFLIIEVIIPGLISIWMALASFILLFLSFVIKNSVWETIIFLILSLIFMFGTRPFVMRKISKIKKENIDQTVNIHIIDVIDVDSEIKEYTIRYKGVLWSALSSDTFIKGDIVKIVSFNGNKANIERDRKSVV